MDYAWQLEQLIALALQEDLGSGDVATEALIATSQKATARWYAKATGIVSGLEVALRVFRTLDPAIEMHVRVAEGESVTAGQEIVSFQGAFKALLMGERTALNFAQRMSGIATSTRAFVDAIGDLPTRLLDTRKTSSAIR